MPDQMAVLFGGNGFVGTAIAERLVKAGIRVCCVSRTGGVPVHLLEPTWAQQVDWVAGDAAKPDINLLRMATVVIALVGSAPVPTLTKQSYENQLATNSLPNISSIAAAKAAGVKRLVVLGAHIPALLQTDKFAYAKGKRLCMEAAADFAATSDSYGAVVLQPTAIYGERFDSHGAPVKAVALMRLIAKIQRAMPAFMQAFLPEQLVSVEAVADAAVAACLDQSFAGKLTVLSNRDIIEGGCIGNTAAT